MKTKLVKMMALTCTMMLMNGTVLPLMSFVEAAYIQTCQMQDYYPFNDGAKEDKKQTPAEEKKPLTFKERLAAKMAAETAKTEKKDTETTGVKPGNLYIPAGQKISVELLEAVSSKGFKAGTLLKIKTKDNILLNDVVVIAKDTEGTAYIYEARKAGGGGRKGKLKIAGNELYTVNGLPVPLREGLTGQGKTDGGAVAVMAAVSLLGGFLMKGSNVNYPAGTIFDVEVRENTDLNCTAATLAEVMNASKPRGVSVKLP